MKDNYIKRQSYMLSSLGLFYLIIIGLFAVPLLASFVVVLIKGVVDLRYAILVGGSMLLIVALCYLFRFIGNMFRKIRKDGFAAGKDAKGKMRQEGPVEISVLNGLLTFRYGGRNSVQASDLNPRLPYHENAPLLLPETTEQPNSASNMIIRLKELSALKNQGVINEEEFQTIKARLIRQEASVEGHVSGSMSQKTKKRFNKK